MRCDDFAAAGLAKQTAARRGTNSPSFLIDRTAIDKLLMPH